MVTIRTYKFLGAAVVMLMFFTVPAAPEPNRRAILTAVPFTEVTFADSFWLPRLQTNRKVTVPYCFRMCEQTGRIDNFAKAAGMMSGKFVGIRFNDSDVFKVIEGAAYTLALEPDPNLDAYLDDLITKIAGAQEPDGYLYTCRTIDPNNLPGGTGPKRWSFLQSSHELYNVGHMYEAAVAHYRATSKRSLLDVAIKNADLIDRVFGPDGKHDVPGHEEIEIGLVKLYRVTGREKYLKLAQFFLEQRGRAEGRKLYGPYCQDHKPVVEQDKAVGHAVRAGYLYTAMADVAALTGNAAYLNALDKIWNDVVSSKLYITGGIGARHGGESFGEAHELPNASAYCETCASIANALWNYRMFLLHEDAKYLDIFERVVYNGFLSGVGLSGDRFFYTNPLASDGGHQRSAWFGCACCPTNIVRFLPSLPGYVYACKRNTIYVNLFVAGTAAVKLGRGTVTIEQQTRYPWDGRIRLTVKPDRRRRFELRIRIPGWAQNQPVPGGLYRFAKNVDGAVGLAVNEAPVALRIEKGFACIRRRWSRGDTVTLELPMPVRKVLAHPAVKDDHGRCALQRGPLVYCFEGIDNPRPFENLILPLDADCQSRYQSDLLGGLVTITVQGKLKQATADGTGSLKDVTLTAIPYYAWAHRGKTPMAVWLPFSVESQTK